MKFNLPI